MSNSSWHSRGHLMKSKKVSSGKTLLLWIAEYGCKYLVEDITKELLFEILGAPATDLPPLSVKQTLIMHCIENDVEGLYGEAISALNSLHIQAEEYNCSQIYLRLALGIRIKDLIHGLSLPTLKYQEKVDSLISEQYLLPGKQLKQIFSAEELSGFKLALPNVCNYFTNARHDEKEIHKLKENVGKSLTETLTNLGKLFFNALQSRQPLCTLEQILLAGRLSHPPKCSSDWDRLLVKHLSGINILDNDTVRRLLVETRHLTGRKISGKQGSYISDSQTPSSNNSGKQGSYISDSQIPSSNNSGMQDSHPSDSQIPSSNNSGTQDSHNSDSLIQSSNNSGKQGSYNSDSQTPSSNNSGKQGSYISDSQIPSLNNFGTQDSYHSDSEIPSSNNFGTQDSHNSVSQVPSSNNSVKQGSYNSVSQVPSSNNSVKQGSYNSDFQVPSSNNSGKQGSYSSVSQVPSSQQEDEEDANATVKRKCVFHTPNIKKFMKSSDIKGCVVLLTRTDSFGKEIK